MKFTKALVVFLLTIFSFTLNAASQKTLINKYSEELKSLVDRYNAGDPINGKRSLKSAFGYTKTVIFINGECRETYLIFWKSPSGETEEDMVSARIVDYRELEDQKPDTAKTKVVVYKKSDSLTFKAKTIYKNQQGYLVNGNVVDNGVEIPVTLYTQQKEQVADTTEVYSLTGLTYWYGSTPIGTVFSSVSGNHFLLAIVGKNPVGWTSNISNTCYTAKYEIPAIWWNGERNQYPVQKQLEIIKSRFPKL